jgi:hypothetical protein
MAYVEQIWARAETPLPALAIGYFRLIRRIDLKVGPPGDLRFDWHCPWQGQLGGVPSLVARYTDAVTGAPRGLWRRPVGPDAPKPMSLGPTGGCVIRLWPDNMINSRLVIAEGIETALAMAMNMKSRPTASLGGGQC